MSRIFCTAAVMLVASVAHAQTVTHHDDETVTIRAESVPIAVLLAEITRDCPIDRVTIQPGHEQQPVSIVLERAAPAAALVAVLKASGLDFAVSGRRIVAGDWTTTGKVELGAPVPERDARDQATEQPAARATKLTPEDLVTLEALGDETTILPTPPVRHIANGENITYLEPNFVPYKMRPHVRALRMAIDVATIP